MPEHITDYDLFKEYALEDAYYMHMLKNYYDYDYKASLRYVLEYRKIKRSTYNHTWARGPKSGGDKKCFGPSKSVGINFFCSLLNFC